MVCFTDARSSSRRYADHGYSENVLPFFPESLDLSRLDSDKSFALLVMSEKDRFLSEF